MSFPRTFTRCLLLILLLALPLQGVSAAGMLFCATMQDAPAGTGHADHAMAGEYAGHAMPVAPDQGAASLDHDCAACAACVVGAALAPAPLTNPQLPGSAARVAHVGAAFFDFLPRSADKPPISLLA